MSKLSFRARALDASKPLPVFRCEDLPDLHEYASINRAVPQMPTGMEKEEESVRPFKQGAMCIDSAKKSRVLWTWAPDFVVRKCVVILLLVLYDSSTLCNVFKIKLFKLLGLFKLS
uniref:Enhancer of polycomb homolog 1 n=1 Tax=Jaculus jaculus TaxID=51337 RepID=A0A8C5KMU1_JACJA